MKGFWSGCGYPAAPTAAKKKSQHAAEQDRPDVKAARRRWFGRFRDVKLEDLVFIDEFGATTNMTRTRARGPVGQRIVCKTPHGHWKILSTIAAMNARGMITGLTFDGATDTEVFVLFVERCLVPVLRPGQVSCWTISQRTTRRGSMPWWRPAAHG